MRSRTSCFHCRAGRVVAALSIMMFSASAHADGISCGAESVEPSPRLERAIELYDEGWGGADDALLEAEELLEELRDSSENSPLVRAYYGSSCIARARQVPDGKKRYWLRRGASELDAAAKAAPEDLQVRLLRAFSLAVLPRLAGRMDTVEEDFDWLIERAEGESEVSGPCRQAIFYHAGSFAVRNRDPRALEWLERAAELQEEGEMEPERVERMLRLARQQLPREDG